MGEREKEERPKSESRMAAGNLEEKQKNKKKLAHLHAFGTRVEEKKHAGLKKIQATAHILCDFYSVQSEVKT